VEEKGPAGLGDGGEALVVTDEVRSLRGVKDSLRADAKAPTERKIGADS